jgi:hypothetical protein
MVDCVYCGSKYGNTKDHVIPVCITTSRDRRKYRPNNKGTVDCCEECNRSLGDNFFLDVEDRARFLLKFYSRKYRKLLLSPDWTEKELKELGYNLQKSLKDSALQKKVVKDRLWNLNKLIVEEMKL